MRSVSSSRYGATVDDVGPGGPVVAPDGVAFELLLPLLHAAATSATRRAKTEMRGRMARSIGSRPDARMRNGEGTEPRVKVKVDLDLCVGHGRCYVLAPDVFASDDFGHCELLVTEVDGALAEQARLGAENCPERAISLED
jgi:ferredoxin